MRAELVGCHRTLDQNRPGKRVVHVAGDVVVIQQNVAEAQAAGVDRDQTQKGPGPVAEGFGGEPLRSVLQFARDNCVITTMDVLTPGDPATWVRLVPLFPYVDHFLPNEEQLGRLTGTSDLTAAAGKVLACGPVAVLASRGENGCALFTRAERMDYPAFPARVIDTTGCGDACSAGFIIGLLHGWPPEDATWLAMAAASLVVGGLGSDAGIVDLDGTLKVIRQHAPAEVVGRLVPTPRG